MSIALMGFIQGAATTATQRIDKEREENTAMIQNRLKMAAQNRQLRQKEVQAKQDLLRKRYDTVSSYLPEDATEEQKLALISNEEIAKQFVGARSKGEQVDLNQFLIMNRDSIPENFDTVQQYIQNISSIPAPVPEEQVEAIRQTRGFLGARVGANVEQIAQQFGASAGELLAYESRNSVPVVPQFARINIEAIAKRKDAKERMRDAEIDYLDAVTQHGMNSQEAQFAKSEYDFLKAASKNLNPEQLKFADMIGAAKMNAESARRRFGEDSAEYMSARDEVIKMENQFKTDKEKTPALSTLRTVYRAGATEAVMSKYGNLIGNGIVTTQDADGNTVLNITGLNLEKQNEVRDYFRQSIRGIAFRQLDMDGRPLNADVETALRSLGVEIDADGRAIFPGQGPRRQDNVSAAPQPIRPDEIDLNNPLLKR
jgi:hypothetical protein